MREGWEVKTLSEVGQVQTGTTPPTKDKSNYGNYIAFVKPAHFHKDGSIDTKDSMLSEEGLKKGRLFNANSVLMVCIGATIGKTGFTNIAVSSNQQINALTPSSDYEPKLLYYALISSNVQSQIMKIGKSSQATLPIINKSKWEKLQVTLPIDKEEQTQIVSTLDKAFKQIDQAKANLEKNLNNAKELFQSKLNEVFSQRGEGWEEKKLGDICNKNQNIKWNDNQEKEFQYIDLSSVSRDTLRITETTTVNSNIAPSRAKKIVNSSDVIFATTRPTLKRVTLIPKELNNQICSTGFIVLKSKKDLILSEIIYYFLQTTIFMDRMEDLQRGASYPAVSDKDVNQTIINFPILLKEQQKIVKELDKFSELSNNLQTHYQQKLNNLEELKKSILQKAFRGEL